MSAYALYILDQTVLDRQTELFQTYMEPMLQRLQNAVSAGTIDPSIPEIIDYLEVCRWPFRKLEYSFALAALLPSSNRNGYRFLDAGSGVTPFAYVFAALGSEAHSCDTESRIIDTLTELNLDEVYGGHTTYHTEDLTSTSFSSESFDAISCISVLEHIPAPLDQRAVAELCRILRPGGRLVITVDFAPTAGRIRKLALLNHYLKRSGMILRSGEVSAFWEAVRNRQKARKAVKNGHVAHARTANQRFEFEHLEEDIIPILQREGSLIESPIPLPTSLQSVTPADARKFWDLIPGLYQLENRRDVIPVGMILEKSHRVV